jgi:hypothetical protein
VGFESTTAKLEWAKKVYTSDRVTTEIGMKIEVLIIKSKLYKYLYIKEK